MRHAMTTLTVLTPDRSRAERTLAKCRARLQRRTERTTYIERAVVTGISALYLLAVVADSLRVYLAF